MERRIGTVQHYYPKRRAAVVHLEAPLHVGDHVHLAGKNTDFEEDVPRIELDHRALWEGLEGQDVGVQVDAKVRPGDVVYLVE